MKITYNVESVVSARKERGFGENWFYVGKNEKF